MGSSVSFLSKNGREWVAFVEKWVGMDFFLRKWMRLGLYCRKMGRSVSLLPKNGWEWVAFLEKWVVVGCFS